MTAEESRPQTSADAAVGKAYRQLAVEKTPQHLDAAVLEAAHKAVARPQYARSRAWTRPLAWAATIVLTVAVVIEINRVPVPDVPAREPGAPAPVSAPAQATGAALSQPAAAADIAVRQAEEKAATAKLERDAPAVLAPQNRVLLQRASEPAELRSDAALPAAGRTAESVAGDCPPEAMTDPGQWLACIEELEAAGMTAAAAEQRRLLQQAFPDFEAP